MSLVNYHESYGFDSLQKSSFWWDDFEGDSVKDYWSVSGSATVADGVTGAAVRLATAGSGAASVTVQWGDIRSLHVSKQVAMEYRMRSHQIDSLRIYNYLIYDASNRLNFMFESAATGWRARSTDGGVSSYATYGDLLDTEWHNHRIQCHIHGSSHVHFYNDDIEVTDSPITTNIPDDAADFLQPRLYIVEDEAVVKTMDIDYVAWRQDR